MHTFVQDQYESHSHPINFRPSWVCKPQAVFVKTGMSLITSFPVTSNAMASSSHEEDRPSSNVSQVSSDVCTDVAVTTAARSELQASAEADASTSPGRRGDPRMHRAVAVRTTNPHMSLIDALLHGGFVFPGLSAPGASDRTVRDSDGVLLYQRKNQLNRRLRLAKQKNRSKSNKRKKATAVPDQQRAGADSNRGVPMDGGLPQKPGAEKQQTENNVQHQRVMPTASAAAVLLLLSSPDTTAMDRHAATL
uniref:Uncharacterized protein n=1 Tax=Odontella aurita TaxID=265563 RepID=A0A7S4N5R4_9STRA|mmetsp:Transcript_49159/g.147967  ORF Transcript_49159/g.147967 Transcript_49159/m.147967 type:complete len:250 (+) Transcript_49159:156-905(+)